MQRALEFLQAYRKKSNKILKKIWISEIKRAEKIDKFNKTAIEYFTNLSNKGKRVRGGLTLLGYLLSGKSSNDQILKASLSLEIFHTAILIHDDIIDKDKQRRGIKTAHNFFLSIAPENLNYTEKKHFGISQAINLGDYGILLSLKILMQTDFAQQIKQRALFEFISALQDVVYGQMLDCTKISFEKLAPEYILKIFRYKTAVYTGVLPLKLGLILSDSSDRKFEAVEKFGYYLGLVFQIKDDLLNIFGDQKKTGKPLLSDIREGKNTFFLYYISKYGSNKDKEFIKKYLGKHSLTKKEIFDLQEFFRRTGSLDFVIKKLEDYKQKALEYCAFLTQDSKLQELLRSFVVLAYEREK